MAYDDIINSAAQKYGLDPDFIRANMMTESGGKPGAVSPVGATGLMQLMPATAKAMGVTDIKDPTQNIMGGAKYLKQLSDRYGNLDDAVMAYNMGPTAYDDYRAGNRSLPAETAKHIEKVSGAFAQLKQPKQTKQDAFDEFIGGSGGSIQTAKQDAFDEFLGPKTQQAPMQVSAATPAQQPQQIQQPVQRTAGQELGRQAGLTARAGISGVAGIPLMIGDVLNQGVNVGIRGLNRLAGTSIPELAPASAAAQGLMTQAGLPQPENATERVVQDVASAMAGTGGLVKGGQALTKTASPTAQALGNVLSAGPGTQVASAAGSAGAAGVTREAGGGEGAQLAAGLVGGLAPGAKSVVSKTLTPAASKEVKLLTKEGITPTQGQILGGALKSTEEKLTSVPILGDKIISAQQENVHALNRAVYKRALQGVPDAQIPTAPGRQAVDSVYDQINKRYDELLGNMSFKKDTQFANDLTSIKSEAASLPDIEKKVFNNFVNKINGQLSGESIEGDKLKQIQSSISKEVKRFSSSPDPYHRELGERLDDVFNSFNSGISRANPAYAKDLKDLNKSYANYAILRRAASGQGAKEGIFSPEQLASAVRAENESVGKGAYGRGKARMQDLSDAAVKVLGNKYPDTGTAGRSILGNLALGGLATSNPVLATTVAGAGGAAMIPYTAAGKNAMAKFLTREAKTAPPSAILGGLLSAYGTRERK